MLLTGVGAAIVLWMVLLCDYYYFFYCILIALLIVLWFAITSRDAIFMLRESHFLPLAAFTVVVLLLVYAGHRPFVPEQSPRPAAGFS